MEKSIGHSEWLKADNIDLKNQVDCETENCEFEAKYWLRKTCCGDVIIVCSRCVEITFKAGAVMIFKGKSVTCSSCNETVDVKGWLSKPHRL